MTSTHKIPPKKKSKKMTGIHIIFVIFLKILIYIHILHQLTFKSVPV